MRRRRLWKITRCAKRNFFNSEQPNAFSVSFPDYDGSKRSLPKCYPSPLIPLLIKKVIDPSIRPLNWVRTQRLYFPDLT